MAHSDFPFCNDIRKANKQTRYLLNTETGKLKTDGGEGLLGGCRDLPHGRNTTGKSAWPAARSPPDPRSTSAPAARAARGARDAGAAPPAGPARSLAEAALSSATPEGAFKHNVKEKTHN